MSMFNKIWVSIKRNWGKSVLFLIMTFILGSIVFGAMIASQAVINTEMNLRRNLPPVVTIEHAPLEVIGDARLEFLTLDRIREIGQLPYVAELDYSFHTFGWEIPRNSEWELVFRGEFRPHGITTAQHIRRSDFIDLNQGLIQIVAGRTFTDEELLTPTDVFPVLISDELASLNHLSVGSIFDMDTAIRGEHHPDGTVLGLEEIGRLHFEFQVVGIFELTSEIIASDEWDNDLSTMVLLNRLYTPVWVSAQRLNLTELFLYEYYYWYEKQIGSPESHWAQLVFVLHDPLDLPSFEAAASEMVPEFWEVVTLSDTFAPMTGAMQSINWIAEQIVYFVITVAIIVLTLLIVLMLHSRRHEVGIYLALGEKRWKIVVQMMLEVVFNATLGIIVAVLIGNVLARTFSEQLLITELAHQLERRVEPDVSFNPVWDSLHWFSPGVISLEEAAELHEITIEMESVFIFIGASLLVVMVSSVVPIAYLTKINPKKVLL